MQQVGHLAHGEHHHLEGDNHGEHQAVVHAAGKLVLHPGNKPGQHTAHQKDARHRGHGNPQGVAKGLEELNLGDAGDVVCQTDEGGIVGIGGGQAEGLCGDEQPPLEGIHQHHCNGKQHVDCRQHQKGKDKPLGILVLLNHAHCSTSLLRVILSCSRAMVATIMVKTTALACPTPSNPVRP